MKSIIRYNEIYNKIQWNWYSIIINIEANLKRYIVGLYWVQIIFIKKIRECIIEDIWSCNLTYFILS